MRRVHQPKEEQHFAQPQEEPRHPAIEEQRSVADPWWLKLTLAATSLAVVLIAFEVLVRIAGPALEKPVWNYRPSAWYLPEGSPDHRNGPYLPQKSPGTFRVIVVGDSFSYGGKGQYYDAFPKKLEQTLNLNQAAPHVEVLNWGMPGYSTRDEVRLVKSALATYQADLVILQITLNDPELAVHRPPIPGFNPITRTVNLRSPVFRYWKSFKFVVQRYYSYRLYQDFMNHYHEIFHDHRTWSAFSGAIRNIRKLSRKSGVPVFAVIFPLFSHPADDRYPFAEYHSMIGEQLQKNEIPFVDLRGTFAQIPPSYLVVSPGHDQHPNEIAHRLAADRLLQSLIETKLLPAEIIPRNVLQTGRRPVRLPPAQKPENLGDGAHTGELDTPD